MTGGVFALGNFDGVHRGHRLVIDAVVAKARALGVAARVLTFEPHPRAFFQPQLPPFRLTPPAVKARVLKTCGIDDVTVLGFTPDFAQISASDFVQKILRERFGVQHVLAGHDFCFGHRREGDMQKLAEWLNPHGIGVSAIEPMRDDSGEVISSTRIRALLQQGAVAEAAVLLGRDWSISGTVIQGAARGRTIGVPTANIALGETLRPRFGVYAVTAGRVGGQATHRGVANIGTRPTVAGTQENMEAHLFDFDQDIYGQEWEFALTRFIRPERKFESFEALKAQIAEDMGVAWQFN